MLTRSDIIAEARSWIGTPYRHQASLKGVGCDCLGLVRGVWRTLLGEEPERAPPYSPDWAEALQQETLAQAAARHLVPIARDQVLPGDVLLFMRFRLICRRSIKASRWRWRSLRCFPIRGRGRSRCALPPTARASSMLALHSRARPSAKRLTTCPPV